MNGTSVKGIGSLLNFVGTPSVSQTAKDAGAASFTDMMNKAQNQTPQKEMPKDGQKLSRPDEGNVKSDNNLQKTKGRDEIPRGVKNEKSVNEAKDASDKELSPENIEQIGAAAANVISEVAATLDVDVQEVLDVLDDMGLEAVSVLDPKVMQDLVVEIKADGEPIAMIANEELFNTVKDLNAVADAAIADLADDMDIEVSDVVEMLRQTDAGQSHTPEMQMSVEADSDQKTVKEEPKITVNISRENKDITLETDNRGNIITAQKTVTKEETSTTDNREQGNGRGGRGNERYDGDGARTTSIIGNGNQMLQGILNAPEDVPQTAEVPQNSFFSENTQNIMDQIMDNMKVNLKPEMDELEMQLHPESLGMVKVNLVNKAGEITAEFKVTNETVKAAMEAQLVQLRDQLRDNGVRVESVEVSVDTGAFDSNLYQGQGQNTDYERQDNQRRPRRINLGDIGAFSQEEASDEEILAAQMMEANGNTIDFQA